ncbi:IS1595 family transposase [Mesorhizobium sp.]|uniref:IS1595 family transposase n=1 Tax=Mesorhizobium sp. TaxID=1871066 RepID=UPI000FE8CF2C|nr:IS1595 family transposase [Mesorhizobium sp.]RWI93431.1 MAG: IS1595 family transposase [Mesorhizobium sp.]TIQ05833.1 MAG: IS1595 family transposase [Mesorhizobium sp.]TIR18347.1 MAG: IS1595 family transposase [Mesorhizobium sp.]
MANLTDPIFNDENKAREHLEAIRWADGVYCPHCGNSDGETIHRLEGKSTRPGLFQCNACRQHFTVTVGTVMERSKIPLAKWVLGFHLYAASKKGLSAHQLHRMLGVTYKTAWFMAHRIREAMKEDVASSGPLGGEGKIVEADETYIGQRETPRTPSPQRKGRPYLKSGGNQKRTVVGLVERGGSVRMFHLNDATASTVRDVLVRNVDRASTLYTDSSRLYTRTGEEYASHKTTNHAQGEYVRYEGGETIHSNTIENVFSVFKRGMVGVYQHCGEAHLHRYLAEFDFRYNRRAGLGVSDRERSDDLIRGTTGKRLTYRTANEARYA